jgi:hypothetical protein
VKTILIFNILILLTKGIGRLVYFLILFYKNLLTNYCFDFDDCKIIVIYNFLKMAFFFIIVNLIWLLNISKHKPTIILLACIIFFLYSLNDGDAFFSSPFIISVILYHIFIANVYEHRLIKIIINNFLIFILFNLLFFSVNEFFFGVPFSQKEMAESSNFFTKYFFISGGFLIFLTLLVTIIRFRKKCLQ